MAQERTRYGKLGNNWEKKTEFQTALSLYYGGSFWRQDYRGNLEHALHWRNWVTRILKKRCQVEYWRPYKQERPKEAEEELENKRRRT
jgi:hypothetical protein